MNDRLVIGGQLGSYLIDSVAGRGGMSVVYRAVHARLGTAVAIKVLAPELSADDSFRERFLREAQMAAGIDHPNVIPIYDMGLHEESNSLYIVMRYVAGGDLKTLLATSGPLDPERALAFLTPVARALDAAHARGLVHRDIKPANILLQKSSAGEVEHVYLTDFGIAKSAASISGLTRAGAMVGTVEYMAPEQTDGREVSAQTDVYALACVFYECMTGRIPFHRRDPYAASPSPPAYQSVASAADGGAGPSSALDGPIINGLAKKPSERFATCEQFIQACTAALGAQARSPEAAGLAGVTVAEAAPTASPAIGSGVERSHRADKPEREAAGAEAAPRRAAATPKARPVPRGPGRAGVGAWLAGHRLAAGLLVALIAVAVAVVTLTSSSTEPKGPGSLAALQAVPTNHVSGSGNATVRLTGNVARITVTTTGLLNDAALVHAMHIHAAGKGACPPAAAAHQHNHHLSVSTTDGIPYYGPPVAALTSRGDTTPASILAFPRFPTGGTIRYTRTVTFPAPVAAYIRKNNAVVVIHGIDYNNNGVYDGVLDRSELNKTLTGETTAPALCGPLAAAQHVAALPGGRAPGTRVFTASLVAPAAAPVTPLFLCPLHAGRVVLTSAPGRRPPPGSGIPAGSV